MDFKNILSQLSQISEATQETEKGRIHKAEPGGYGRKYDTDEEGDEKQDKKAKADAPKKGRGRPKKGSDDSGEVKSYDTKTLGSVFGGGQKPKKEVGKVSKKHSLKEWVQEVEQKYMAEDMTAGTKPFAIFDPKNQQAGAGVLSSTNPTIQKMLSTLDPKDLKVVMTTQQQTQKPATGTTSQAPATMQQVQEKWAGDAEVKSTGEYSGKSTAELKSMLAKLHKSGPHKRGSAEEKKMHQINFALRAKGGWKKGEGAAQKESAMSEGDIPSDQVDMGAGLGAGRSQATFEGRTKADNKAEKAGKKVTKDLEYDMGHKGKDDKKAEKAGKKVTKDIEYDEKKKVKEDKKPDANKNGIPDYAEDGKGKNDLKKTKKKVDEGMNTRLKSAHHAGKSHALAKEGYNCRYDDMEEARMYHEGYKEGLDECYGQVPIRGEVVGEEGMPPATVSGMADQAEGLDEMDMYEMDKTEWMKHKAQTTPGGTFKAFGQTMQDKDVIETSMFESWDNELSSLLEEYDTIQEGLTVSISKGQQGSPDSVSVTAQDQEADQLLNIIKSAGLGVFGKEEAGAEVGQSSPMSLQPADDGEVEGDIDVVGDHDGMMALIKKVTGGAGEPNTVAIGGHDHDHGDDDYKDEEDSDKEDTDEATCNECGMEEAKCGCDHDDKEVVDEVESEDQMAYEVAEDNPPDSGAAEEEEEIQDTAQANKSAAEYDSVHEQLDEWANEAGQDGTDASFETDIAFMTKVIAGGLNKEKATGQTTIPVIAGQSDRMGYNVNESIFDFKKLAGIK